MVDPSLKAVQIVTIEGALSRVFVQQISDFWEEVVRTETSFLSMEYDENGTDSSHCT